MKIIPNPEPCVPELAKPAAYRFFTQLIQLCKKKKKVDKKKKKEKKMPLVMMFFFWKE